MTIKQQAKKELNRIKRSMRYREKKYGIRFEGLGSIENRILKREVKRFTKRDLEYLKQIKGEELERYGEAEGGTKGYDITKYIRSIRTQRSTRKDTKAPRSFNLRPLPDEEVKRIREEKLKELEEKIKELDERFDSYEDEEPGYIPSSSSQIIANFLDENTWAKHKGWYEAREILHSYVESVLYEYSIDEFAYVLEKCNSDGQLSTLKQYWYFLGMSASLETYLGPYFGHLEELREFDTIINDGTSDDLALRDYELERGF